MGISAGGDAAKGPHFGGRRTVLVRTATRTLGRRVQHRSGHVPTRGGEESDDHDGGDDAEGEEEDDDGGGAPDPPRPSSCLRCCRLPCHPAPLR